MGPRQLIYGHGKLNREIEDFQSLTGPLAVQEYIQSLIRQDPQNVTKILSLPVDCELNNWKYEHIRQFVLESNLLVVQLKNVCTAKTCPFMQVQTETYKCTVHDKWRDCCAIEYIIHNLDASTDTILNLKHFFSKPKIPEKAINSLEQIVRRLYRLFSHCFFYHKDIFEEFEKEMFLYKRFYQFIIMFEFSQQKDIIQPFF